MTGWHRLCRRMLALLAVRTIKTLSTPAVIEASILCGVNQELVDVVEALERMFQACADKPAEQAQQEVLH